MAIPQDKHARKFYRSALQRFDDARILQKSDRASGAVYLAGYAVECILKALLLSATPRSQREKLIQQTFRGKKGHDLEWLRRRYLAMRGGTMPADVHQHFSFVNTWSTDLRYDPAATESTDCDAFLEACEAILGWAEGRF